MSSSRYSGRAALTVASTLVIAACSSDVPTGLETASVSMVATPAIRIGVPIALARYGLCNPAIGGTRPCGSSGYLSITNSGGGTLNWTASKDASWLRISPKSETAPSTVEISAIDTGLSAGTYYGHITVSATGATNSPQMVTVRLTRR